MQTTKCNDTQKPPVLHDLESILYTYMQFNMNRKINLTQSVICSKAREVFNFLMYEEKQLYTPDGFRTKKKILFILDKTKENFLFILDKEKFLFILDSSLSWIKRNSSLSWIKSKFRIKRSHLETIFSLRGAIL